MPTKHEHKGSDPIVSLTVKGSAAPDKTAVITPEQRAQLARAFHSMPYGGSLGFRWPDGGQTAESVLYNLELLQARLRQVGEQARRDDAELAQLRRERATVRSFLGLDKDGAQ
jgi:hypothetical protein